MRYIQTLCKSGVRASCLRKQEMPLPLSRLRQETEAAIIKCGKMPSLTPKIHLASHYTYRFGIQTNYKTVYLHLNINAVKYQKDSKNNFTVEWKRKCLPYGIFKRIDWFEVDEKILCHIFIHYQACGGSSMVQFPFYLIYSEKENTLSLQPFSEQK